MFFTFSSPANRDIARALDTGELTVRDIKGWVFAREDVLAYLYGFTEARMIISALEVRKNIWNRSSSFCAIHHIYLGVFFSVFMPYYECLRGQVRL